MKVALLAPANSVHIHQWVEGLHQRRIAVGLITQHPPAGWTPPAGVSLHVLPHRGASGYFRNASAVRRLVGDLRPELLHAHYASGYGTTARLSRVHPLLLSVWGSDVFDFPRRWWRRMLLTRNLRSADRVASTSHVMAAEVRRLVPDTAQVTVTPFGVDATRFAERPDRVPSLITIGTVKTLAPSYGIDVLIRAFARLRGDMNLGQGIRSRLRLLLVGDGPERPALEALTRQCQVAESVRFIGAVPHHEVPAWLNRLDVYVAASRRESFGVAVIEASACAVPVVVSDAGGLPEVVRDGETGLIVPSDDEEKLAAALRQLVEDAPLRRALGEAGRAHVLANYDWPRCLDTMIELYEDTARLARA